MVAIAQLVEHRSVEPAVVGASPTGHPSEYFLQQSKDKL